MSFSISCPSCGKIFRNIRPELAGKKAKCKCGALVRLGSKPAATKAEAPLFDQDFSDLDAILEGVGDVAPLAGPPTSQSHPPKRPSGPQVQPPRQPRLQKSTSTQRPNTTPGYIPNQHASDSLGQLATKPKLGASYVISGVVAGTIAIWYGLFVVVSRFKLIEQFPLSTLSSQLQSAYTATFGLLEVPARVQSTCGILGWVLFAIGLVLIFIGIAQVINSFVQILLQRPLVRWVDGIGASLAIASVFVFACFVFTQSSFIQTVLDAIPAEVEQPIMEDAPEWANQKFTSERSEIESLRSTFNNSMFVGAGVCMTMFILSMVRVVQNSRKF